MCSPPLLDEICSRGDGRTGPVSFGECLLRKTKIYFRFGRLQGGFIEKLRYSLVGRKHDLANPSGEI